MLEVMAYPDSKAPLIGGSVDPATGVKLPSFRLERKLFVGDQTDYVNLSKQIGMRFANEWAVVHCCKEPHHREMLGYEGRAAPKDHPEYLFGIRGNRLILNLVDVEDPQYVREEIIDAAMSFIDQHVRGDDKRNVLVHCNQGRSRSPTIAMLYLGMRGALPPTDFDCAESEFKRSFYPPYDPARGMREFARQNWTRYTVDKATGE